MAWTYNLSSGTITDIFSLWFIGALISIIVGLFGIGFKTSIEIPFKIDFDWIKKGIKVAAPFFLATVFYKIIEFSGRFFLDYYWTKEDVGIFTFFSGISNAMFVFVQSTVIIVLSPYLIESANKGFKEFRKVFNNYRQQILLTTSIGFSLAALAIYPLLLFVDNELLLNNVLIFFVLLLAVAFFCFSYIPHYGLYSFHRDKSLLKASIIGAVVNVLFNFVLVPNYGVLGAAIAQAISMCSLFITKEIFFKKFKNE